MPVKIDNFKDALDLFADLVSLSPLVIFLTLLYNFLILPSKNVLDLVFFLYMMLAGFVVRFLKDLPYPKSWRWVTDRPKGAANCDYFSRNGLAKPGTPGMPSGHMTHTTIFATVMILGRFISTRGKELSLDNLVFYGVNVSLVLVMAFSRYHKKCHNIPQISLGFLLGLVMGIFFYYLMKTFFLEKKSDVLGSDKFLKVIL